MGSALSGETKNESAGNRRFPGGPNLIWGEALLQRFSSSAGSFLCLFVQRLMDPLQRLLQFLADQRKIDADKLPIGISEG